MVKDWRNISVLIAGCGSIGKRHARVLNSLGVKDIRACDPSVEQCQSLLEQVSSVKTCDSFEMGLHDQPDAVLICTPPAMHIPMACQAIRRGCHVLTEKPLSDRTDGIDELEALAEKNRKKVMVALCFRYHAGLLKAREYLVSGRIERLVSVRALMGENLADVRPDYRNLFSAKMGGVFDLMHDIDLAIWFTGQSVQTVRALYGTYSDIGIEAPDIVEILMGFKDRCVASVHLDFFQRPRRRQMELIGTNGVIIVEFAGWDHCSVSVYETTRGKWEREELITDRDDMFRAEDLEFLEALASDKPIQCTIAEGRKSLEVVFAAQHGQDTA